MFEAELLQHLTQHNLVWFKDERNDHTWCYMTGRGGQRLDVPHELAVQMVQQGLIEQLPRFDNDDGGTAWQWHLTPMGWLAAMNARLNR